MALSDKEKESFPSRGNDGVQPNTKHHNKCMKRLEYSMRRSKFLYSMALRDPGGILRVQRGEQYLLLSAYLQMRT